VSAAGVASASIVVHFFFASIGVAPLNVVVAVEAADDSSVDSLIAFVVGAVVADAAVDADATAATSVALLSVGADAVATAVAAVAASSICGVVATTDVFG